MQFLEDSQILFIKNSFISINVSFSLFYSRPDPKLGHDVSAIWGWEIPVFNLWQDIRGQDDGPETL